MFKQILNRCKRQPMTAVAIVLFAAVLSVVLGVMHQSKEAELSSYKETYNSIPVFFTVTDLDGSQVPDDVGIQGWALQQFTELGLAPTLAPFVRELHIRLPYLEGGVWHDNYRGELVEFNGMLVRNDNIPLVGISSTYVAEELTDGLGGGIQWREGYDDSILASDEFVCIIPEWLTDEVETELHFMGLPKDNGDKTVVHAIEFDCTYKVVGTYNDPNNNTFYCSLSAMEWVYAKLSSTKPTGTLGAILKDNNDLEELREVASKWFATPNSTGEPTPWGHWGFDYFPYALDIDDAQLQSLSIEMQNIVRFNRIAAALVIILSAGAGFLVGFLVMRARKREIILMRTLGASNKDIYKELALEQLLCIGVGIVLGGSYALWQPVGQLLLFGIVYCAGLTVAIQIFLRKNLLATIKEDE